MKQWVVYRPGLGAFLRAQLPSASDVGGGWRGAVLRTFSDLSQLDELVTDTAAKTGAALGVALSDEAGAYLSAADDHSGIAARLTLGAEPVRADQLEAFAAWSQTSAPVAVTAADVKEVLEAGAPDPSDGLNRLLQKLGLSLPEAVPHYGSLHDVARESPAPAPPKKGLFRRRR